MIDLGEIVDAHVHFWDPLTSPRESSWGARFYRRAPGWSERIFRAVPTADRDYVRTAEYVAQPWMPSSLAAATSVDRAHTFTVGSVVHVEARWKASGFGAVDETRWLATLSDQDAPTVAGIVAHLNPLWPDAAGILAAHVEADRRIVGVRCSAAHHPDRRVKSWTKHPHLYRDPEFLQEFSAIADAGIVFDAWVYGHQLSDVVVLAREYPDTTIVLDHYGTPIGLAGPAGVPSIASVDEARRWADQLAELADMPNIVAKHSGIGLPVLGHAAPTDSQYFADVISPHVARTTKLFGTQRVMFGSDAPMDLPIVDYPTLVDTVASGVVDAAGSSALRAVFADNARRVYSLNP